MALRSHQLAYVFERFPSFSQTFCFREVSELIRQGLNPLIFSIRMPVDEPPQDFPEEFRRRVHYLPGDATLTTQIKTLHAEKKIPRAMRHRLMEWGSNQDKHRVYAAAYIAPILRRHGIRHVHVHFAGMAARTAYWLKTFYNIGFSFTGHANDIFCETDLPVTLDDLVREASLVVTVSDYSAARLRKRFPDAAEKIHRVYNGIDLSQWKIDDGAEKARPARIVSVGRYIEKKGFADLIDACALLKHEIGQFKCCIVGEGPMQEKLENRVRERDLTEVVELTGPRSQTEVRELLKSATVFSLPCVQTEDGDQDNLPTVIAEAMACGLPVVSTPIAGVPEMVMHKSSGILVPQHDPSDLATAIRYYLDHADSARTAGARGRERAERIFSLDVTTRHLKHLLVLHGRVDPGWRALKADTALLRTRLRRFCC